MKKWLVSRRRDSLRQIAEKGNPSDSRRAAWYAIESGSRVIRDIQKASRDSKSKWKRLTEALPYVNPVARRILKIREEAINGLKHAPHHSEGYRRCYRTGAKHHRARDSGVNSLCLISGHEGQEIPGLVNFDRVIVDVEHMDEALGPATITEIFNIRKAIGEYVYISTNISETPQIVRSPRNARVDTRSSAALTAQKALAAFQAGADVVKVGFANLDITKRDLRSEEVIAQMKLVRQQVDAAVEHYAIVKPRNREREYPLISVFFPEIGIDSNGERPFEIAKKGINLTARGGWQGILIDTYEKFADKSFKDFYSIYETLELAKLAHEKRLEFWIAGSIMRIMFLPYSSAAWM